MFTVRALGDEHRREAFACGTPALDNYLREQATQDMRRRVAACFVATHTPADVVGYYTLAAAGLALEQVPAPLRRKLPRYPQVPCVRIGRLAVSTQWQGRGLGSALLADALARAARAELAAWAALVDAKDGAAARFYLHHGFLALPGHTTLLFLPLATVAKLLR